MPDSTAPTQELIDSIGGQLIGQNRAQRASEIIAMVVEAGYSELMMAVHIDTVRAIHKFDKQVSEGKLDHVAWGAVRELWEEIRRNPPPACPKPVVHELKIWTDYSADVMSGKKPVEARLNDRDFKPGDFIKFLEWRRKENEPTGSVFYKRIVDVWPLSPFEGTELSEYAMFSMECAPNIGDLELKS